MGNFQNISKVKNAVKGRLGETLAENYLKNLGYLILQRNFEVKFGEIDLIAKDGDTIVFVEVKERATNAFGTPAEAVNFHKQMKIRKVAEFYLMKTKNMYANCRFDVVEVLDGKINHIKNAF